MKAKKVKYCSYPHCGKEIDTSKKFCVEHTIVRRKQCQKAYSKKVYSKKATE